MERYPLLSKFKGVLHAALAGDSIGAVFERDWAPVPLDILLELDKKLKHLSGEFICSLGYIACVYHSLLHRSISYCYTFHAR